MPQRKSPQTQGLRAFLSVRDPVALTAVDLQHLGARATLGRITSGRKRLAAMAARLDECRLSGGKVATPRGKAFVARRSHVLSWREPLPARCEALVSSAPESFVEARATIVGALFALSES